MNFLKYFISINSLKSLIAFLSKFNSKELTIIKKVLFKDLDKKLLGSFLSSKACSKNKDVSKNLELFSIFVFLNNN